MQYGLIVEVDDPSEHSWSDEFATEAEAKDAMRQGFRDALEHAHQSVVAYVSRYGEDEVVDVARLVAYGYRPDSDSPDPPVALEGEDVIIASYVGGNTIYWRANQRRTLSNQAASMVAHLFDRGEWHTGTVVRVYAAPGRVVWVWEGEDYE
jgi:hypothetical protein